MIDICSRMFEPKRATKDNLSNYIGARVTDAEEAWLRKEMEKRQLTMSDLIRLALGKLHVPKAGTARPERSAK